MNDRDVLAQVLNDMLPAGRSRADWATVLLDAGVPTRQSPRWWRAPGPQSRLAIAVAILLVCSIIPLAAVAISKGLFAAGPLAPQPVGAPLQVGSGDWSNGVRWRLTAYQSEMHGLCIALTPSARDPASTAETLPHAVATRCDLRVKEMGDPAASTPHLFTSFASSVTVGRRPNHPDFVVGAAAEEVTTMRFVLEDGRTVESNTFAAPANLALPIRFFVTEIPSGDAVRTLVALDLEGHALEQMSIPRAQAGPASSTTTGTTSGGVDSAGP